MCPLSGTDMPEQEIEQQSTDSQHHGHRDKREKAGEDLGKPTKPANRQRYEQ